MIVVRCLSGTGHWASEDDIRSWRPLTDGSAPKMGDSLLGLVWAAQESSIGLLVHAIDEAPHAFGSSRPAWFSSRSLPRCEFPFVLNALQDDCRLRDANEHVRG